MKQIVRLLIIVTVLYGSTYQQYRHFNMADPRGASDAASYIKMLHGDYNVSAIHRYRPVVPYIASLVRIALGPLVAEPTELDKLSFYVVNFTIATATAYLLLGVLTRLGFGWQLSYLGMAFFLTSRTTVLSVGTPLIDSLYFFAIIVIIYLMLHDEVVLLACACPLLVLSKETILAFLFLPFARTTTRKWKMVGSIILSLGLFTVLRSVIQRGPSGMEGVGVGAIVMEHVQANVVPSLQGLLTLSGLHGLLNSFAFLLPFALFGAIVNRRHRKYDVPSFVVATVPIAFVLGLVSGNMGRMMFAAYVPVIAYSLILIEQTFGPGATEEQKASVWAGRTTSDCAEKAGNAAQKGIDNGAKTCRLAGLCRLESNRVG